jgi:hypothetical protein
VRTVPAKKVTPWRSGENIVRDFIFRGAFNWNAIEYVTRFKLSSVEHGDTGWELRTRRPHDREQICKETNETKDKFAFVFD